MAPRTLVVMLVVSAAAAIALTLAAWLTHPSDARRVQPAPAGRHGRYDGRLVPNQLIAHIPLESEL